MLRSPIKPAFVTTIYNTLIYSFASLYFQTYVILGFILIYVNQKIHTFKYVSNYVHFTSFC